jgi:hypothetical protein
MVIETLRQGSLILDAGVLEELTALPEAPTSDAPLADAEGPMGLGGLLSFLISPKEPKEPKEPRRR